ncbi:membrane protein [Bacteroidia bacterium]|nr:membrane protein [Bacteroidia bacterium]
MLNRIQYICLIALTTTFFACKSTKFVPDGEYLLDRIHIESDVPGYSESELTPYLKQHPNFKMFGVSKVMLHVYSLSGKKDNGFNRFIRKLGDEPVLFDSLQVNKTVREFQKLFVNMGYSGVDVWLSVDTSRYKRANVSYFIRGNEPYRIRHYETEIQDSILNREIFGGGHSEPQQAVPGESPAMRSSLVKDSLLFNRNILDAERDRITGLLKNRGYYAFSKDRLVYDADSALNAHSVDLTLRLRELPDSVADFSNRKFFYDKFRIYLDFDPLHIANLDDYPKNDSIHVNGYTIYYTGKKPSLRPNLLLHNCFITPGQSYSQQNEDLTYAAFSGLRALNNIHFQFAEKTRNDSTLLDSYLLAIPARKQTVTYSIEGTNTAGDLGAATSVNYSHRNLFRGSETFNLRVRAAYETMSNFSYPYWELGGEASLDLPKIIFPFVGDPLTRRLRTSTEFLFRYNYQTRPEYDRTLVSGGLRYKWQGRQKFAPRHQFDLVNVDYVYLPKIDFSFLQKLPENALYFGYLDQFIVGMNYAYYYSTSEPAQKRKNAHTFRFSIESAGNLLYGLSNILKLEKDEAWDSYLLFKTPFAQFVKGDFDYTKNIVLDEQNSIAWHIGGGIGFPYGNSQSLPFEKRYYSGGANSVRAWSIRQLGPGSYQPDHWTTFYEQSGDIKLDFNIEYRSHFFWKLEAAAYIDAGNIWTIKNYEEQAGGQFRLDSFYKEIAFGYGLGLRLDFDYFLIRFDTGMKAYNPAKNGKDRWAILHPNFGENFAWHIAVGYPF